MKEIDASLFAHIENDSSLSGTYKLEGNRFGNTARYLKEYLERRGRLGQDVPAGYSTLLQDMNYLVHIENKIKNISLKEPFSQVEAIAKEVTKDLLDLPLGKKILLPGGWISAKSGHAMVYEVIREKDGYRFTVYNSGSGLQFHAKKSSQEKELYNPMKIWHFPSPKTPKENTEIQHFIGRLLASKVYHAQKKRVNADILYHDILPSIHYIGGKELDANVGFSEHAYTGGQLSGTCAQRCLHQMLKIITPSSENYLRFIFDFKMHALFDYAHSCIDGSQPFNAGVADQLRLSIENNLKILNTLGLNEKETDALAKKLIALRALVNHRILAQNPERKTIEISEYSLPQVSLKPNGQLAKTPDPGSFLFDNNTYKPIHLGNGTDLLHNMENAIKTMQSIPHLDILYEYLEQFLLTLPINPDGKFDPSFYKELKHPKDVMSFQNHLHEIQLLLKKINDNWLKEAELATIKVFVLGVASLEMDAQEVISHVKRLPSFAPFAEESMQSALGNCSRNPFWATNHPKIDDNFLTLQARFQQAPRQNSTAYFNYFKTLLDTEPELNRELKSIYHKKYSLNDSKLHREIQKEELGALYLLSLHLLQNFTLDPKFNPLIKKLQEHLDYDSKLKSAINVMEKTKYSGKPELVLGYYLNLMITSSLNPLLMPFATFSKKLSDHKYSISDASIRDALNADVSDKSAYSKKIKVKSANKIQLKASSSKEKRLITQKDIIARDYLHLRSNPFLQVPLTLDYFTRNIDKLSEPSDQSYVEANLFQPGLLVKAAEHPDFLDQFDKFLQTGCRQHAPTGSHTRDSLFYVRLDYLVSRYLSLIPRKEGLPRLKHQQNDLLKQIILPNSPETTYVLQQYLFLNLMTQIELGGDVSSLFPEVLHAFFYLNGHTNPLIFEDTAHHVQVERAKVQFQKLAKMQPESIIQQAVKKTLSTQLGELTIKGSFPVYQVTTNEKSSKSFEFDAHLGKLFDRKFAYTGVPLPIKNHILIKHLHLEEKSECLMSANENLLIFPHPKQEVRLISKNNKLVVQKDWTIKGKKQGFELQALTHNHLAFHANNSNAPVVNSLPAILKDGSIDYWHSSTQPDEGILVQNDVPQYSIRKGKITALDKQGYASSYQLSGISSEWLQYLINFESKEFFFALRNHEQTEFMLQRYGCTFKQINGSSELIFMETGEHVVACSSPIAPNVAGLVLQSDTQHTRYLVPIQRFYAIEKNAQTSEFYPVVHDTEQIIAQAALQNLWNDKPPQPEPMWHYQNSERYASFQLKDGIPMADTVADALYLAYIYLATNQPAKAWDLLEDCNTRLGGLTGNPEELKYITWICKEMPHILPRSEENLEKATRQTPSYVACQAKATALLSDYLIQGRGFDLKIPQTDPHTANYAYDLLQYEKLNKFLAHLPKTIYELFTKLQGMRRHLEYSYSLSTLERKRLLDYYSGSCLLNYKCLGSLGYEWMTLSLEALLSERDGLLARQSLAQNLTVADTKRLALIEKHLNELKPVVARSSILELIPIGLELSDRCKFHEEILETATQKLWNSWTYISYASVKESQLIEAIDALGSEITEEEMVRHLPAFLYIASSSDEMLRKPLFDFCTSTLIARRHIPLDDPRSNIPMLSNVLYRILENTATFKDDTRFGSKKIRFSTLIDTVKSYQVHPLSVYQAKDIYQDILANPQELALKERPKPVPLVNPPRKIPHIPAQQEILIHLSEKNREILGVMLSEYRVTQEKTFLKLEELGKKLNQDSELSQPLEVQAGALHLELEKQQLIIARQLLGHHELAPAILKAVHLSAKNITDKVKHSWFIALKHANQGPSESELAQSWFLQRESKARAELTQSDLLSMYCRADTAYSAELTGLSTEEVQKLHDEIHQALINGIEENWIQQLVNVLQKSIGTGEPGAAAEALSLLTKNQIPGLEEPAMVMIQHEEKILLHSRQVSALQALLARSSHDKPFNETVQKIIMGGGKSKIILPILAEKKAQGDNLVIVEVPQALLGTNHVDLNRTSQRLFGKRAYRFEFERDNKCSPEDLELIYQLLTEVITTRSYLVTNNESMPSLELKYLELLLYTGKKDETWKQQVYWLDKITGLIHHHGDCIIDEVHQGLSIKKKLNYTLGEDRPLNPVLIRNATALYTMISSDFIQTAPSLPVDFDWTTFQHSLAIQLINEAHSPLHQFIMKATLVYGPDVQQELLDYLTNKAVAIPEAIRQASLEDQDAFVFFRHEINVLLPQTLTRKMDEHYGASKREGLDPVERTLAIPYSANDTPNEQNRFGVNLAALNYGIQMMLIKGVSKELLIEQLREWQALARQQLLQNKDLIHLDETSIARSFALMTKGSTVSLGEIKLDNHEQIATLHKLLQYHLPLITQLLTEHALKQIRDESAIIHSDPFNHVDVYRTTQAISGTPNPSTYHQRLNYDGSSSLGTDGYIIQNILDKNTAVSGCDYHDVVQFMEITVKKSSSEGRCRAIIDINATFVGISNASVARDTATFIVSHPQWFNRTIQHVLYFNKHNVLCAIQVNKPEEPIILAISDSAEIDRLLGSTPDERFTYYDQVHTVGVDIKQGESSHALVLVDDKTALPSFLQGSMRMRELSKNQTIELVVPQKFENKSAVELIDQFTENYKRDLTVDNLFAAKGQLTNHIRRDLLSRIQDLPSEQAHEKSVLMQHFKKIFIDTATTELFSLYGSIRKEQETKEILQRHCEQSISLWNFCLTAAQIEPTAEQRKQISTELQEIIQKTLPHCLPTYEDSNEDLATEVTVQNKAQMQSEIHTQKEKELLSLTESFDPALVQEKIKKWDKCESLTDVYSHINTRIEMTMSLNTLCDFKDNDPELFSPHLLVSKNYAQCYKGQYQFIGAYLKPVFLIWYYVDQEGILHATIVTPQEAEELIPRLIPERAGWVTTTQDFLIAGQHPEGILLDERYQRIREQVRFFNGELGALIKQETPLYWLKEKTDEKLEFFEKKLEVFRPGSAVMLRQLKNSYAAGNMESFVYIAQHPFQDLTGCDWSSLFPKIIKAQAAECQNLARAFAYLNQSWSEALPSLETLQQQFQLPLSGVEYLNQHLEHLNLLKGITDEILVKSLSPVLLENLSEHAVSYLEECIGITLPVLLEECGIKEIKNGEPRHCWQHASLKVLLLLSKYPGAYNENKLTDYLLKIASDSQMVDVLKILLQFDKPSSELVGRILNNSCCNELLVKHILNSGLHLSEHHIDTILNMTGLSDAALNLLLNTQTVNETQLFKILKYPGNKLSLELIHLVLHNPFCNELMVKNILHLGIHLPEVLIDSILEKRGLSDSVLCLLVNTQTVNETQLFKILKYPADKLSLELIHPVLRNRCCNELMIKHILDLGVHLPEEFIDNILERKVPIDSILNLLLKTQALNETQLLKILKSPAATKNILETIVAIPPQSHQVLLAILSHPQISTELVGKVILNDAFSIELAYEIVRPGVLKIDPVILKTLNQRVNNLHKLNEATPEGLAWEKFRGFLQDEAKPAAKNAGATVISQQAKPNNRGSLLREPADLSPVSNVSTNSPLPHGSDNSRSKHRTRRANTSLSKQAGEDVALPATTEVILPKESANHSLPPKSQNKRRTERVTISSSKQVNPENKVRPPTTEDQGLPTAKDVLANHSLPTKPQDKPAGEGASQPRSRQVTAEKNMTPIAGENVSSSATTKASLSVPLPKVPAYSTPPKPHKIQPVPTPSQEHLKSKNKNDVTTSDVEKMDVSASSGIPDIIFPKVSMNNNEASQPNEREVEPVISSQLKSDNEVKTQPLRTPVKDELDFNFPPNAPLKSELLALLDTHSITSTQIDVLLQHDQMTSDIADILFSKAEYSGKIRAWKWLTEKQLVSILAKAQDYESLKSGLTHLNLSDHARKQWFNELQKTVEVPQTDSTPPQLLLIYLNQLKAKACEHAMKAITQPGFEQVAETAFNLYCDLNRKTETYLKNPKANRTSFQESIEKAKPVLNQHRGYKQLLLDILNVALTCVSFQYHRFASSSWRFFKEDTATMKITNKIIDAADDEENTSSKNPSQPD